MEQWTEVRHRVLTGQLGLPRIRDQLAYAGEDVGIQRAPGYRQQAARQKPVLEPFLPIIHEILEADKKAPKKQRHTATRIFHRLQDEHDYPGGYTSVRETVSQWREQSEEVFLPLSHPQGEAQIDLRHADVDVAGERIRFFSDFSG